MIMNWGKGIAIALIGFIVFIVTLGVKMMKADADLVSDDYYKKEVVYGNEIVAQQNAKETNTTLEKEVSDEGVMLSLNTLHFEGGTLLLRRSNDPSMDIQLEMEGSTVYVESTQLQQGKYDIIIDWKGNDRSYQHRDLLWIP